MFKIGKFQGVIIEDNGFPWNSSGVREKMVWNSRGGGGVKNEIEFQGGMTSENGYPQQGGGGGGLRKFLEKPNRVNDYSYGKTFCLKNRTYGTAVTAAHLQLQLSMLAWRFIIVIIIHLFLVGQR